MFNGLLNFLYALNNKYEYVLIVFSGALICYNTFIFLVVCGKGLVLKSMCCE